MNAFKKTVTVRVCLTVLLGILLACIGFMCARLPDLRRIDLIPQSTKAAGVRALQPGEEMTQSVYAYRELEQLILFRTDVNRENPVSVEILQNNRVLYSGTISFQPGESEQMIPLSTGGGTLIIHLANCGEQPLSLPLVEHTAYDPDNCVESEEPLLKIGLVHHSDSVIWTLVLACLILAGLSLALIWGWGKNWSLKKSMIFILVICLVYLLLFPAWNINDFGAHFATAYSWANSFLRVKLDGTGELMVREEDREVFKYVLENSYQLYQPSRRSYDDAAAFLFRPSVRNDLVSTTFVHRVLRDYGFWNYVPYVLGILISRLLSLNLVTAVFLGRCFGIALYLFGIGRALKKLPDQMLLPVTVLSCLPLGAMNLTAVSYDALCYVVILNLFACFVSLRDQYRPVTAWSLLICSAAVGMIKGGAYVPVILSLLLLLSSREQKARRLILFSAAAALLGLAFNHRELLLGGSNYYQFGSDGYGTFYTGWAFSHPFEYLVMVVRTYLYETDKVFGVIGRYLGWNSAALPESLCALFWLLLITSCLLPDSGEKPAAPFSGPEKIWLWGPITLMLLLTPLMLLIETDLSMITVEGVQGRYFFPLLVPIMLLCRHNLSKRVMIREVRDNAVLLGMSLLTLLSVYYIVLHFMKI